MMPARMTCKSFCARNWADFGLWAAGNGFWCSVSPRGCLPWVPLWGSLWSSWHGSARAGLLWDAEVCHSTFWNSGGVISLRPFPVEHGLGQGFVSPHPQLDGLPQEGGCWSPFPAHLVGSLPQFETSLGLKKDENVRANRFLSTGQYWICFSAQHRSKSLNTNHKSYLIQLVQRWLFLSLFFKR